jgi:uncharacterized protein (DUF302 family)
MIVRLSPHDASTTAERVERAIQAQGLKLFALIAHDDAAADVGLSLPFTRVFIFGNPRTGTPLMQSTPSLAIDLPLRVLVWEDGSGVWVGTNAPDWIGTRHAMLPGAKAQFAAMKNALDRIAIAVTGSPA